MGQIQTTGVRVNIAADEASANWECFPMSIFLIFIPNDAGICGKAWYSDHGNKIVAQAGIADLFGDINGYVFGANGNTMNPTELEDLLNDDDIWVYEEKFINTDKVPTAVVAQSNVGVYWGGSSSGVSDITVFADKTLFFFENATEQVGIQILGSIGTMEFDFEP